MHSGFMSLRTRRVLHARAIATGVASDRRRPHPDQPLLEACRAFNEIERRKIAMLRANQGSDDLALQSALGRLDIEQEMHLHQMCEAGATTMVGHRARAMAFASWDGGDLAYRVEVGGATEDLILQAVIRDLTCGSERP